MGLYSSSMEQQAIDAAVKNAVRPIANKYGVVAVANALRNVADEFNPEDN